MKALIAALSLVAASTHAEPSVSFRESIAPVLKTSCAVCHLTGQEAGNIALHPGAAYASLVNVKSVGVSFLRVNPGAPDQSYLMMKLEGTHLDKGGQGARMPFGAPPLDPMTLQKIREWIAAGASDN